MDSRMPLYARLLAPEHESQFGGYLGTVLNRLGLYGL